MRFALVLPSAVPWTWHRAVADALADLPAATVTVERAGGRPLPASVDLLLRLERLVRRIGPGHPTDAVTDETWAVRGDGTCDILIDLGGQASAADDRRGRLVLSCGGERVEQGAVAAIFAGTTPVIALDWHDGAGVRPLARWATAVENRAVLALGLADVLGRAVQLVVLAATRIARGTPPDALDLGFADPAPAGGAGGTLAFAAASLATTGRHRLERLLRTAPQWFVAVRADPGSTAPPVFNTGPFTAVPDGGRRFFADPFPAGRDGKRALFVEEYPFATAKGVITVLDVADDGRVSAPRVIIETDCHLSYPYLVEDGGTLFMIPETSGRRTVELWRCVSFPDRWEQVSVLIEGRDLSDATVVREGTGWLMFAASRERWCSSWDALDLWRAPALAGPWTRVGDGPVLVDPRVARPAGSPFLHEGRLIRPVQDCSFTYGGALAFAAVETDGPQYRQTMVRRIRPAAGFAGMHSWARSAGLEVIDLNGRAPTGPFVAGADVRSGTPEN